MDDKRKGEIALAALKIIMRKELSLRDIANVKRNIGNTVKEKEMVAIKVNPEELLDLSKLLLKEILNEQMEAIS